MGSATTGTLDCMIHPDIVVKLSPTPRIADIGTGTGDHLIRLSQTYPDDSEFHGFGISPGCFCAETALPQDVKLHVCDIRKLFWVECHNRCNLIHLGLSVGGLPKDDWIAAIQNALQLLRPGGAVQWEEHDPVGLCVVRSGKAGLMTETLRFLLSPSVSL